MKAAAALAVAIMAIVLAVPALAQTAEKAAEPAATAPKILNPSAQPAEPYAGQKPAQPVEAAKPSAAAPVPTAKSESAPSSIAPAPAAAAAAAAKVAVPEGPPVKPIEKTGEAATPKAVGTAEAAKPQPRATETRATETRAAETRASEAGKASEVPVAAAAAVEPVKPTLLISIDLTNQKMTVKEGSTTKFTWRISSGRTGYLTPRGTFRPIWMSKMWYSRKYDYAPMPHSIFFHGGTAIHGTDSVYALGRPASHGCVRLAPNNASALYRLVTEHGKQKTEIKVFGTPPNTSNVASRDDDSRVPSRARRYRDVPDWYDDYDDDMPPPRARLRRYSDRYYDAPSRYSYPRRPRRMARDYDYYDY